MSCKLIEKEKEKTNKLILNTILCLVIIVILILITIFHKQIFKNISWESMSVMIACLTLIFTIIYNRREKRRSILIEKNIREQEKFEQEIEKILEFYPRMIEDYIKNTNFKLASPRNQGDTQIHFDIKSLDELNALNAKYICEIITINNKMDYLYKFHAEEHPEYDKFKIKINDINQILSEEINNFSILVNECTNNGLGFTYEESHYKIEKRTIYLTSITNLYQKNIEELYVLANNCVEERNELSLK